MKITLLIGLFLCGFAQSEAQTAPTKYLTEEDVRNLLRDTDNDGVIDLLDQDPNTPKESPVDTHGVTLDSDGDGVKDYADREPFSCPGIPVDMYGIMTRPPWIFDWGAIESYLRTPDPIFPPVYFATNSCDLTAEAQVALKGIALYIQKSPKKCLAINGYTDDHEVKNTAYSQLLSYNRAKAIADFLITNYGISNQRLVVKIRGTDNIIKKPISRSDQKYNRRVEFVSAPCGTPADAKPANVLNK
jgi:OmpA-OmpF porin, OOP family